MTVQNSSRASKKKLRKKAKKLYDQGLTNKEIAEKLRIDQRIVAVWKHRYAWDVGNDARRADSKHSVLQNQETVLKDGATEAAPSLPSSKSSLPEPSPEELLKISGKYQEYLDRIETLQTAGLKIVEVLLTVSGNILRSIIEEGRQIAVTYGDDARLGKYLREHVKEINSGAGIFEKAVRAYQGLAPPVPNESAEKVIELLEENLRLQDIQKRHELKAI